MGHSALSRSQTFTSIPCLLAGPVSLTLQVIPFCRMIALMQLAMRRVISRICNDKNVCIKRRLQHVNDILQQLRKYSLQSVFSESKGASCNVETENSKIGEDEPGEKPLPLRAIFYCSSRPHGVSHDTKTEGANQTSHVDAFVFRKMQICLIRHKH